MAKLGPKSWGGGGKHNYYDRSSPPYVFLICAEGLSSLLLHEEEASGIDGIKVCIGAPSVSHLLFADDSLVLMKEDLLNAASLQQVLDTYYANLGQLVSTAK